MPKISITGVCERDIDLLLVEEFATSPFFLSWFASKIGGIEAKELISVHRSVVQSNGESDLEVRYFDGSGQTCLILIENKVGASFHKDQAFRYQKRAENYLASGLITDCRTVLFAPAYYLNTTSSTSFFDSEISYEELVLWFKSQIPANAEYKIYLLGAAIEKSSKGYNLIEDGPVSSFWLNYWEVAQKEAPELLMKQPKGKPAGAGFVHFYPMELPKGIHIIHKLTFGVVDLEIAGGAKCILEIKQQLSSFLAPSMQIERAAKSAVVRVNVSCLDPAITFSKQSEEAFEGISEAKRLLAWAIQNSDNLNGLIASSLYQTSI